MTRPNITYADTYQLVSMLPRTTRLYAVKGIFRYLQGTLEHGLWFGLTSSPTLVVVYSNTDWADCKDSHHFTSYAMFLGPNIIACCSKKWPTFCKSSVPTFCKSSTEAEYKAIGYIVTETMDLQAFS